MEKPEPGTDRPSEPDRIGRMTHIGAILGPMEDRFAVVRQRQQEERQRRIAEGHERWRWPLDAACDNCGDTGKWPNSMYHCNCAAGRNLRQREEMQREEGRRIQSWQRSGVPRRFAGYRIATAPNERAAAEVAQWIDDRRWSRQGENLLLSGPVGTGKTGLAIGALWAIHEFGPGYGGAFWSVPDLLDAMRPGAPEPDPMTWCRNTGVLVLDDLGVEKASDWVRERLYVLVDARYGGERPTIVTTNRDLPGLAETLGERIVSRLAECMTVVFVDGPDRRRV
jgi:DNA replication protein DnaC